MTRATTWHRPPSVITALRRQFDSGTLTAVAALRHYLERIAEYDKHGPCVNAILEINPDALAAAARLDLERRERGPRSLLHGVPIVVKDNINTRDRLNATAGCHYLLGIRYRRDAHVVARLRRAGAVVMATANMDELATGNGTPSGRGGQIRNPYCPTCNASGSSGGSAAAVAAEFCAAALGTDTQSSVRYPAADCSLVGIRPTVGLLSCSGIFPGMATIDAPGPMTASVTDAAIMLRAMAPPRRELEALYAWLTDGAVPPPGPPAAFLRGVRIGVMTDGLLGYHAGLDRVIERALAGLARAGATLVDVERIQLVEYGGPDEADRRIIQAFDNLAMLRYFDRLPACMPERSFDLFRAIASLSVAPSSLPALKRALHAPVDMMRRLAPPPHAYAQARQRFFASQRERYRAATRPRQVDVIVFPTKSVPARSILHTDRGGVPSYPQACLASFAGVPEVTVPAGYTSDHLPVGLSFVGPPYSEALLLRYAYVFEQTMRCWKRPRMSSRRPAPPCTLPARPVNDAFAQAAVLTGATGRMRGNTLLAGIERHEPRHGAKHATDRSVWFRWTAPDEGRASFRLAERRSSFHVLAIYTGETLPSLVQVACTNDDGVKPFGLSFEAHRGQEYRIAVASAESLVGSGDFELEWRPEADRRCLQALFEWQVETRPDAVALVCADRHLTVSALERRTNQIAGALRDAGVVPESRVGICVARSEGLAIARLAVLKAGGAYVPVDPNDPVERIASLLTRAGVTLVLTEPSARLRLSSYTGRIVDLQAEWPPLVAASATPAPAPPATGLTRANLAYVLFTSGSTGEPKGVLMPHDAVVTFAEGVSERLEATADDRMLQFAAPAFDVVEEEIWPVWARGGTVVTFPDPTLAPLELADLMRREQITLLELPTAYWHMWVGEIERASDVPASARCILIGGERISASALARWRAWGLPVANVYGLTEAAVTSTLHHEAGGNEGSGGGLASGAGDGLPLGRPIAGTRLYVGDGRMTTMPEPAAREGELLIGGAGLARGYLDRPDLTAARFIPDPFSGDPGARLYRTGDRVRRASDDLLFFIGRIDAQIKLRGFRVEPAEIEAVLLRHPQVREAAVAMRELAPGEPALVAFIIGSVGEEELRAFAARQAPDYMTPARVVHVDALPTSANGKVDRRALPAVTVSVSGSASARASGGPSAASAASAPAIDDLRSGAWAAMFGRAPAAK